MIFAAIQPMHIPDGFLSVTVSLVLWALSVLAIAYALGAASIRTLTSARSR